MNDIDTLQSQVTERVVAIGAPAQADDEGIWDYLIAHINEFAVAKSIVDHFDTNPKDLGKADVTELDLLGVYLRAKVTLKREQISYAQAQVAVSRAREQSRSVLGRARAFARFVRNVGNVLHTNPAPAVIAACMGLVYWLR